MSEWMLLVSAAIWIAVVSLTLIYVQERIERALGKGRRRDRKG